MKEHSKENRKKYYYIGIGIVVILIIGAILYLILKKEKYSVTFTVDNQIYKKMEKIVEGNTVALPTPEKEGYTFDGWYVNDKKFDTSEKITGNTVLTAKFTINTYCVTFDSANDTNSITEKVTYNETVKKPETPVKKGYIFDGWYLNNEKYDFSSPVTKDITIVARWIKNTMAQYTVETYLMNLDGKYTEADSKKVYNGKINSIVEPKPEIYKGFVTPDKKSATVKEDGSTTIKYYYERKQYDVTIAGDEGIKETKGSGTYYYGSKIPVSVEVKDGYNFVKWSNDKKVNEFTYTVPSQDVVLEASTKLIDYTISVIGVFNGVEETVEINIPKTYTVKDEINLESLEVLGYTFKGYTLNDNFLDKNVIPSGTMGDLELKAIFDVNAYNVFFTTELGEFTTEENRTIVVNYKELVPSVEDNEIYEVTREGYEHIGWSLDKEIEKQKAFDFNKTTMPAEDIILYPLWKVIPYQISYVLNKDEVCKNCSKYKTYTIESAFTLPIPEKEGYKFVGWNLKDTEEVITKIETGNMEDITLIPKWEKIIDAAFVDEILSENTGFINKVSDKEVLIGYKEDATVDNNLKNVIKANLMSLIQNENITKVTINGQEINENTTIDMNDFNMDAIKIHIELKEGLAISADNKKALDYTIKFRKLEKITANDLQSLIAQNTKFINDHKEDHYEVVVNNKSDLVFKYNNPAGDVFTTMMGAGLKTAMQTFLGDQKIGSVIITLEGMKPVEVTYDDIKDSNFWGFGFSLLDSFEKVIGKDAFDLVNEDLIKLHATLEIIAPDGKYYDDSFPSSYTISFAQR